MREELVFSYYNSWIYRRHEESQERMGEASLGGINGMLTLWTLP